jgi:Zn-dependent protease/predicted transcriptional regulator
LYGRESLSTENAMLRNSVRLFTIADIEVGVHYSWLIVFALVTWSLAIGYFPTAVPGSDGIAAWVLGAIAALLLFASVLVHELAHSLVAKSRGLGVHSITLFLFGGVSNLTAESRQPGTEFAVAIVGPITSFAIGIVAVVIAGVMAPDSAAGAVIGYLAVVNLLVGAFNLIPGFPLDGGRVLRSIVWSRTGSLRRATEIAVAVGQVVSYGFLLWGVFRLFSGDIIGGIWIAIIGWFLQSAGSSSLQQVVVEQRLSGLKVADVARGEGSGTAPTVAPNDSLQQVVEEAMLPRNRRAVAVVSDGMLRGLLTAGDIAKVPSDERPATRAADAMVVRDRLVTVRPTDSLRSALEALGSGDYEQAPVIDREGRFVGLMTRGDALRAIQLREVLDVEEEPVGQASTEPLPSGGAPHG